MSLFVGANPCDTELFEKNAYSLFEIKRKRLQFKTLKSPALRGFVAGPGRKRHRAFILCFYRTGGFPAQFPIGGAKVGGKQRRCLSGVQGCRSRPQSRTQRLTGGIAGETGRSRPPEGGSSCMVWSADLFHPCLLFRRRLFDPVQQVLRLLQPLCHLEQPRPGVGAVYTK